MSNLRLFSPGGRVLLGLACLASLATLSFCLFFSQSGLDLTDEGYYLNLYNTPGIYPLIITFFGFVYSLPYRVLGENIAYLRAFNIITVFAAGAWCIDMAFAGSLIDKKFIVPAKTRYAIAFSLSGMSLLGLGILTTPSYNHLALIGCFLVAGALMRTAPLNHSQKVSYSSSGIPLVIGVVLASLAKPTTGIVLEASLLAYAMLSINQQRRFLFLCLLISGVISITLASVFSGGPYALMVNSITGLRWLSILGSDHHAKGLAKSLSMIILQFPLPSFAFSVTIQSLILLLLLRTTSLRARVCGLIVALFLFLLSLIRFLPIADSLSLSRALPSMSAWFLAMPFAFAISTFQAARFHHDYAHKSQPIYSKATISRLFLILLISFYYGFGTNTGILGKALSASLIFACIALHLVTQLPVPSIRKFFAIFLLFYLIGAVALLPPYVAGLYLSPYRQPGPLDANTVNTRVGRQSRLRLSRDYSEYIRSARSALFDNGFKPGTPILDFTGQSPGLIYAVEGRAAGSAWMIGGYIGSNNLARQVISKIPCNELHSAWLVVEVEGPKSLDISILQSFGIDIADNSSYRKVVDLHVPQGVGINGSKHRQIIIYKPKDNPSDPPECSQE